MRSRHHRGQRPFIPPASRTRRIPANCNCAGRHGPNAGNSENSEYMRKLLTKDGLNSLCCLNSLMLVAACACAAPPRWCHPRYQRRQCPMPTAGMVRIPGRFGISAWLRRSGARKHPRCRWERTARDPRRDRRHNYASPHRRCPAAPGEGLGSCQSSDHATFSSRGRVCRGYTVITPWLSKCFA
jgi:hypothetical protein